MDDHANPEGTKKGSTVRIAALLILLAAGLLLWESISPKEPAPQRPPYGLRRVASRTSSPPVKPVPEQEPEPVLAPTLPPPPPEPPPVAPVDPTTLNLSDIIIDPTDPAARFAVIDGVAVRAGETIGGHQVVEVQPDRVLLGGEGTELLLPSKENH